MEAGCQEDNMNWLYLTAISILFRSIYGVMTKVMSNKVKTSVYTQAAMLPFAGALITLAVSPFLGGLSFNFTGVSLLAVALVVVGQGLGNITYFEAIKSLTNGTAQIAFSSILLFNTFLSLIFLNLTLSPLNIVGLILLMLAILSVANGKIEMNKRGVLLMLLAALLFSVFQISSAHLSKEVGASTYLLIAYLGAAGVVFLMKSRVIIRDIRNTEIKQYLGIPLLTALPSIGNFLFAYYAYKEAPEPARVAMLLTSQVVLTVLLSYFFLNEKGHLWRKVLAAMLVVISAILIKS
jgi:drug/metabolite transporter (DMT)-like permease